MKVVRMYNSTPNTLISYNIPFDGTCKRVATKESVIIGNYNIIYDKFYMAMIKTGFEMSIEDESDNKIKNSVPSNAISKKDKEKVNTTPITKRQRKSRTKAGDK